MDYQYLSVLIEHAADYVADIAKHIIMIDGIGEKIPVNLLELMVDEGTEVVDLYIKAVNAFFQHDLEFSVEIMKQTKRIEKLDQEIANTTFISNRKPELICAVCSIREDIKRIAFYAANIAEVTVNHAFKVST
jgi:phosphate uptake regulator